MGLVLSTNLQLGYEEKYHPEIAPRNDRPATFDPQYGFENGRKEREMVATKEEMDRWGLEIWMRDYCAHKLIPYIKCQQAKSPLAAFYCHELRHEWDECEKADYLMRMKEFERERRLLKRMKRKQEAAATLELNEQ